MKTRIISGLVGVAILVFVMLSHILVFDIAVTVLSVIALLELYKAVGVGDKKSMCITGAVAAVAIMGAVVFSKDLLIPVTYIYIFILFMLFMAKAENMEFKDIAKALFVTAYVLLMFSHLSLIRRMENGEYLIWFLLIISILTDTFAYFTGRFLGKHKLAPVLSPKKTVEGAVGGLLGAVLGVIVYCFILKNTFGLQPNFLSAIIIALVCSPVSQLGDLSASAIKRQYGIKDYGNIMPGHGGVMDRFDSIMFTAPAIYYLLCVFSII